MKLVEGPLQYLELLPDQLLCSLLFLLHSIVSLSLSFLVCLSHTLFFYLFLFLFVRILSLISLSLSLSLFLTLSLSFDRSLSLSFR